MTSKPSSMKNLGIIVNWLNKTEGRDKLCKVIQYSCLLMGCLLKEHDYYSLQFETLFKSVKEARKLFRLFKSIIEYQNLISILLDDDESLLKIFRVLRQVCFFFYWFFDNIAVACKIKLIKGDYRKKDIVASIFWLCSLLIAIPVLALEAKTNPNKQKAKNQMLDCIKYTCDLLPSSKDSKILERAFNITIKTELAAIGGLASGLISTYQVLKAS